MADRTITVNTDHTASLDHTYLAIQGEQKLLNVVLPAELWALGYDGYVDFLLPDGTSYFKGPYDCSTGTISFSLGATDSILDKEGKVFWQFILAVTTGSDRESMWVTEQYETKVLPSINATSSALGPYIPQMVFPVQYPAANISVADVANHFVGGTDEDILAEIGLQLEGHAGVNKLATDLGMIDNDPTKAVDNYTALNAYINGGISRTVFLNGGKFWISQKLSITQRYTAIIGNNRGKNPNISCIAGDFVDTVVEVAIPSGLNGWYFQNIAIDGNNKGTIGLDTGNSQFADNLVDGVYIYNINGVGLNVGIGNYSCIYKRVYTSNCLIGLILAGWDNQQSNFSDCNFTGTNNSAILGTSADITSGLRCINFTNCDFTSAGTPLTFNTTAYSVKFTRCWIEQSGPVEDVKDYLVVLGNADSSVAGLVFDTCFFQCNEKVNYVFNWHNAGTISFIGYVRFMGPLVGVVYATDSILTEPTSTFTATADINPTTFMTGKKIAQLFRWFIGDTSATEGAIKTRLVVDPDGTTDAAGSGALIESKRRSDAYKRVRLLEGGLYLGSGAAATDVVIQRIAANVGGLAAGDSWKMDGTYDGGHLILGTYHVWVSAGGKLYIKSGVPTSDTDGTIVGTQT